jgi:hypothetical protein
MRKKRAVPGKDLIFFQKVTQFRMENLPLHQIVQGGIPGGRRQGRLKPEIAHQPCSGTLPVTSQKITEAAIKKKVLIPRESHKAFPNRLRQSQCV